MGKRLTKKRLATREIEKSTAEVPKNQPTEELSKNEVADNSISNRTTLTGEESISDCTLTREELKGRSKALADNATEPSVKKSWIQRLNPFHIGKIPPIPESDAGLVPEMMASWLSKLTWNWMSPLMMVIQLSAFANFIVERLSPPAAKRRPLALRRKSINTHARR